MADELNIPTHRWYQKRNHIALAKKDVSRQYIYDSGIQKIDAWINSQPWGDVYIVNRLSPKMVFDFDENYYRTEGTATDLVSAATHTRASSATYVDANGILQTAAINEPRVGHHIWNGSAWVDEGYLHESEARTNLAENSNGFNTASWSLFDGTDTLTSAAAVSPDGSANAWLFAPDNTNGVHILRNPHTFTENTTYTISVFIKASGRRYIQLVFGGQTLGLPSYDYRRGVFDLNDGTVHTDPTDGDAQIQAFGNGWYRCSVIVTTASFADPAEYEANLDIYHADTTNPTSNTISDGNGTDGILIYGAQLEAGSTPSSYIPTAGAEVTRAADAMTIPAANLPWPEPVVIGPEFVTNGTFDTDTDWTKGTGWTISGGVASFATAGSGANLGQAISTEVGKVYEISCDLLSTDTALNYFYVSAILPSQVSPEIGVDLGRKTFVFVADSTTTTVGLRGSSLSTATFDNVSVREINPLAVSIQMEGTMTYADTGEVSAATFVNWVLDSNNEIRIALQTFASDVGQVNFLQDQSGYTQVEVSSAIDAYSPGINVPFNIASRHGSTFVNGAVDGTAFTANLTPTALPYLENTDMQIGYDFNGTIKLVRVWADDLTDEGIEEGSSNV